MSVLKPVPYSTFAMELLMPPDSNAPVTVTAAPAVQVVVIKATQAAYVAGTPSRRAAAAPPVPYWSLSSYVNCMKATVAFSGSAVPM